MKEILQSAQAQFEPVGISLGHARHASGRRDQHSGFYFGEICNPLRSFIHLGARPMRQAMQSLSTCDGPERRSRIRFPITLAARYAITGQQEIASAGKTVNVSSHGALIRSAQEVLPGTSIRVVIEWPILIGNGRRLRCTRMERL